MSFSSSPDYLPSNGLLRSYSTASSSPLSLSSPNRSVLPLRISPTTNRFPGGGTKNSRRNGCYTAEREAAEAERKRKEEEEARERVEREAAEREVARVRMRQELVYAYLLDAYLYL